jgi:[protein-PII] uridylyltransferase
VETPERLRALLILTVADIRAVGPGVWNGWKGQLMRELYAGADAVFRGGRDVDPATSFRGRQEDEAQAARALLVAADPQAEAFTREMDDAYFTSFSHRAQLAHAALARRAAAEGGSAANARPSIDRSALELTVATDDRPGLFADLAEALAEIGADVVGARAVTSASGRVLDVFFLHDHTGAPFAQDRPDAAERAARRLAEAAAKPAPVARSPEPAAPATPDRDPAKAMVDNETSASATVVEVSARDQPGLLAAIARTLTEQGLLIQSAHVDCYGERAVDAFYVQDGTGRKITDAEKLSALRDALIAAAARPPLAAGLAYA